MCAVSSDDVRAVAERLDSQPKVVSLDPMTLGEVLGDVRTLAQETDRKDQGVDLTFTNWRGVVAAPGITEEETKRFVDMMTEMHDSDAWKKVLADQGWTDAFLTGDEFSSYLGDESKRVQSVLSELGLT